MKYIYDHDGEEDLINAIFVRAAFDYRAAYRSGDNREMKKIEQFFNLTNKGKMILERLKGEQRNDK